MTASQNRLLLMLKHLWQMVFPQVPDFQSMVSQQCICLIEALDALADYLLERQAEQIEKVRVCVERGHDCRRRNLEVLYRTFVTPIDREDVYAVIMRVDHIFDYVETAVREIEMLDLAGDRWMKAMVAELQRGATALLQGVAVFKAEPRAGGRAGEQARNAERRVEELYRDALHDMFTGSAMQALVEKATQSDAVSPLECLEFLIAQMKRREVYRHLSNGADRLAHAGELLHDLGIKYG